MKLLRQERQAAGFAGSTCPAPLSVDGEQPALKHSGSGMPDGPPAEAGAVQNAAAMDVGSSAEYSAAAGAAAASDADAAAVQARTNRLALAQQGEPKEEGAADQTDLTTSSQEQEEEAVLPSTNPSLGPAD